MQMTESATPPSMNEWIHLMSSLYNEYILSALYIIGRSLESTSWNGPNLQRVVFPGGHPSKY